MTLASFNVHRYSTHKSAKAAPDLHLIAEPKIPVGVHLGILAVGHLS